MPLALLVNLMFDFHVMNERLCCLSVHPTQSNGCSHCFSNVGVKVLCTLYLVDGFFSTFRFRRVIHLRQNLFFGQLHGRMEVQEGSLSQAVSCRCLLGVYCRF